MKEPTFDAGGYPTEETLTAIEQWPANDWAGVVAFMQKAWKYKDYFREFPDKVQISTAGWSGNESIIAALMANRLMWALRWEKSMRGGHYEFTNPETP